AKLHVFYWGDIDTHGLAILDRLRTYLPQTHSLMMDEPTLLAFKSLWGKEQAQHAAEALAHLTETELQLYRALREGVRRQVRLEQERIAWDWAWRCITETFAAMT
ncbi:Wadjet anti-phage system protein JetD domain-containing protein, partial [Dyella sp.]|uniref:Wadjet anti-phage system protein JetD domain-containing protein n=1 Tax=Dyella sp. TaxID=1869338 RepID=UPI002B47270D